MGIDPQMNRQNAPTGVGLLGAGVVGSQVARVILDSDANNQLSLNGILVRDIQRQRDGVPSELLTTNPETVLGDERNDIIIEVMGGEEPARSYMAAALSAGKHVVTLTKKHWRNTATNSPTWLTERCQPVVRSQRRRRYPCPRGHPRQPHRKPHREYPRHY